MVNSAGELIRLTQKSFILHRLAFLPAKSGFVLEPRGMPPKLEQLISLLKQGGLTDLIINGANHCFADLGDGLVRINHPCPDAAQLAEIARWMIALADRHLDFANPFADCVITSQQLGYESGIGGFGPDRFRVHAVLASASSADTLLSVRRHSPATANLGAFTGSNIDLDLWLRNLIESRENFLVSGATGAGKTSLLSALFATTKQERIIAIEDVSEIVLPKGLSLSLQTRQANTEGRGAIDLNKLLHEALRMRPDRLLLGEVRGAELVTFLNALNTGHRGAAGTIHANDAHAVSARIESIGLQAGLSGRAVAAAAAEAIEWVIHLERRGSTRRVAQIAKLNLDRRGRLNIKPDPEATRWL